MASLHRLGPILCVVIVLTAGCLSSGPVPADSSQTPSPTPTSPTSSVQQPTITTACDWSCLDDRPDPHHAVQLENRWNHSVAFDVRVIREATNETVYSGTVTLAPDSEQTAYNVAEADPDGIETFEVAVTVLNTTDTTTITTSECFGSVVASVERSGKPSMIYSIC